MSSTDILSPLGPQDPREAAGYRLLARIGEGGMGTVYLSHTRGGQPVALKVIRREYGQDPDFRRRFEQEVQAARRVQGYHLVPVVDHDTNGELSWLATAFIPGIPLHDALAAHGPLPLPAVFQLVGCAARALTAIHAAGVIHRDLKPSNILLGPTGPYVIDFGIARAADATQLTQSGGLIGTPQYMSPEHALGERVGPATDVFSLGLIAAVAATGRHPYGDGGAITIAAQIANTAHRPPQLTSYDDELRPLLERFLAADPADRIGAGELAEWCERAAGRPLAQFDGWLPQPVTAEIARREQSAQNPPPPTPQQAPAAPPTAPPPPATGYGYPQTHGTQPPQPGPHTFDLSPQPAAPAPKRRGRARLVLIAAALVIAVGAGAAAAVWVVNKSDKGDDAAKKPDRQTSASPDTDKKPDGGDPVTDPTADPTAPPADTTYTLVFENKPMTLRTPSNSLAYTYVDLDAPKVDPTASMDSEETDFRAAYQELTFEHPMGKASGATPEQCQEGAEQNPFRETLSGDAINRNGQIVKGDRLCMVTGEGNLAMWTITDVEAPGDPDYLPDLKGSVTLWKPGG
ncbi:MULTISPECIES: serine/threonine-protein kinase [Streptomyces]|uniref:serine/threonine-protein kinase n=1 Tax=Streptomyces TaxID=1883 RepID=UPI0022A943CC|nr:MULTISPECIES: serine/threonine-protein kinase [Streptomyces]UFQ15996.1 serine/threonine protein kinase [Streptomyces huasconensis]WCL85599.1 serine/threonine-protein kinase [Streptomyces sp. JCM 35825]